MFPRNHSLLRAGAVACAALLVGWAALSQAQQGQANAQAPAPGKIVRAHDLLGTDVKNDQGEKIGSVKDVLLTPQRDRVAYVALSADGKLFAIPWQSFTIAQDGRLALSVPQNHFNNLKGFDSDNYPSQADMTWRNPANAQREQAAPQDRAAADQMRLRKVSELIGMDVNGSDNKKLGDIQNLIIETPAATAAPTAAPRESGGVHVGVGPVQINVGGEKETAAAPTAAAMHQGEGFVTFAIVSYGGTLGMGEKLSAVPWNALSFAAEQDFARLNATKESLDATAFAKDSYPDFANRDYARGIYQRYNAQPYWQVYGYTGQPAGGTEAWMAGSEYNKRYDVSKVTTISGTVENVGTFRPATDAAMGRQVRVKAEDGKIYFVHLGPSSFTDAKLRLSQGDTISVTGSHMQVEGATVIIASEVRKGDQTLQLRDREGKPLWTERDLSASPATPADR